MSTLAGGNTEFEPVECDSIRPLLSAYADEETTPDETTQVLTHLKFCVSCASHLAFLQSLATAARRLPTAIPSPALFDRIASATYAKPTLRDQVLAWLAPSQTRWGVAGGLLAAGVAMVLVLRTGVRSDMTQVVVGTPASVPAVGSVSTADTKPDAGVVRETAPFTAAMPNLSTPAAVKPAEPIFKKPSVAQPAVIAVAPSERNRTMKSVKSSVNRLETTNPAVRSAGKTVEKSIASVPPPKPAVKPSMVSAKPKTPVAAVKTVRTPAVTESFAPKYASEPVAIAADEGTHRSSSSSVLAPRTVATPEPTVAAAATPERDPESAAPVASKTTISLKGMNKPGESVEGFAINSGTADKAPGNTAYFVKTRQSKQ